MDYIQIGILAVISLFFICVTGAFFKKMEKGFGPYNSSTLLLILVVFVTSMGAFSGKFSEDVSANLLFAVAGYAGGLMVAGRKKPDDSQQK